MQQTPTPQPKNRKRQRVILALGCAVSLVAIWLATRGVDWANFLGALRRFKLGWLIPAFGLFYFSMYLRAVRWALLFRPHKQLTGRGTFSPLMIGFAFNSILPARVGEIVRCLAINKTQSTGITKAIATVLAERIFDGLILLLLLALSLWIVPIDPTISYSWRGHTLDAAMVTSAEHKLILICILLVAGVVGLMIPAVQRLVLSMIRKLTFLPHAIREKAVFLFKEFSLGFHSLKEPLTLAQVVFHSVILWVLVGVSNLAIAYGFDISMNLWHAVALVALTGIAILLPAAPGYWGLYELGVKFSLALMGVEKDPSRQLAYGLMVHMLQWAPIVIYGLIAAWRLQMKPGAEETLSGAMPDDNGV